MASDEPKMTEHRIDRVEIGVTLGEWRGNIKVGEKATGQTVWLFAKDDGEPLAWGRALEELLERLIERANTGDMVTSG